VSKKVIRHKARAVPNSHEWGFSPNTGTEQVGIRITLIGGDLDGQAVTWYGFFTENSEQRTLEQLEIAGWDKSSVIDLPGLGSTEFELQLEEEPDEKGNVFLRPTFINRMSVMMKNKMDETQKRALAARLGALVGARPAARPAQRSAPATNGGTRLPSQYAEEPPPHTDDDIPF
jgi:hypothetical protein